MTTDFSSSHRHSAVLALEWFLNRSNPPLTVDEFISYFPNIDDEDMAVLDRYLCICKDGFIRVRSMPALVDWYERYNNAQVPSNWAALGIGYDYPFKNTNHRWPDYEGVDRI